MNDDRVERFLDQALGEYSDAAPRTGLEQRVLATLEAWSGEGTIARWWWVAVPSLAAVVIIAGMLGVRSSPPSQVEIVKRQQRHATESAMTAKVSVPGMQGLVRRPRRTVRHHAASKGVRQESRTPRLGTFPSRDGDDELVRLAVRFVQNHPGIAAQMTQEQKDFREMARVFTAPLRENYRPKGSEEP